MDLGELIRLQVHVPRRLPAHLAQIALVQSRAAFRARTNCTPPYGGVQLCRSCAPTSLSILICEHSPPLDMMRPNTGRIRASKRSPWTTEHIARLSIEGLGMASRNA